MANLSDAFGKVTIRKEGKEMSLELLKKIFEQINTFYYGNLNISEDELEFDKPLDFSTTGRWSLCSTLKDYFDYGFDDFTKKELQNISGLIFDFDYTDYEPGCVLFEEGNITIRAIYEDDKLKTEFIYEESYPIGISAENLENYFIYDDAFDTFTEYGVKNFKKFLKEDLEYQDNEIFKKAYNKLLEMSCEELLKFFKDNEIRFCDNGEDISFVVENILDSVVVES
ncbi:hypothetical protein [Finegoldia magna]|uniref:Putative collagen adhesion protein n=1 Tax=Finegoldia magna (strain ATCC 29328 / DSM 20472 / WAL 2508) TaxID=334413 RepID=B0S498_FINM2|nr:hypothetical protein [Finegoldia magna]UEA71232.1 hypothetical protein LK415_08950 [Finegoldia magna]BAG09089.1 putative collagen adhesion protein [Finegoldia magna ATCC 29328]